MKQKTHDVGTPEVGKSDPTTGDGVLKDLAAQAQALAPTLQTSTDGDPRRRGEIELNSEILPGYDRYLLYIKGAIWAELDYVHDRNMWCIQDCMGQCLAHVEHVHAEHPGVKGSDDPTYGALAAIEKAKEMIRNGSMPTPEAAKKAFDERYGY